METVYLSLGSNLGDRQHYLEQALTLLGTNQKVMVSKQSSFYETSPVGGVVQDNFINLAVEIMTTLSAQELLNLIHAIEKQLNRQRLVHWGPRTIDIDIIFYGEQQINQANLKVPHPEAFNRYFVLQPLAEIMEDSAPVKAQVNAALNQLANTVTNQRLEKVAVDLTPREKIAAAVTTILSAVGEDPQREGLVETPLRVAKMYEEILASQTKGPFEDYKLFETSADERNQLIVMKDIPFYSMCEHHMLPFFGQVHVAYLPQAGKIIGLSKIPRLIEYVSQKLQVQENLTREIAETLVEILAPLGVAVVVEARHMCVEMRGIKKLNSHTKTSYYTGVFETDANMRQEFLAGL